VIKLYSKTRVVVKYDYKKGVVLMTNTITIIGNLTKDAELRFTQSGKQVVTFSLAYNHDKESVSYFEVTVWGQYAEKMHNYLRKGKQVAVTGELRQARWEQDGQSRSKVGITARTVQLLGGGEKKGPENLKDDSNDDLWDAPL
jgi:single-strand DNA-binding protein